MSSAEPAGRALSDYPKAMREALAVHEILRRLGVEADYIFAELGERVRILLLKPGLRTTAFDCGPLTGGAADPETEWAGAVARFNASSGDEAEAALGGCAAWGGAADIAAAVAAARRAGGRASA